HLVYYVLSTSAPPTGTYTLSLHDALPIWRPRDDGGEEREGVHEDRPRPGDAARDREIGAREVHVTGLAVKGDGNRLPLARQAAELPQEVQVPGLAAQLPVGDAAEADRFLESDHLADRRLLGGPELASAR